MSKTEFPINNPVNPPDMNTDTNPIANKEALLNRIFPRNIVDSQLNTFTAEGTAMIKVNVVKMLDRNGFTPAINIWCAHTRNDKNPIAMRENTIARYPNIGFRLLTESTSDTIPIAGRITIYT